MVTGLLPGGALNTAAYSVTSNVYSLVLMPLLAQGITTAQRCSFAGLSTPIHICNSCGSNSNMLQKLSSLLWSHVQF